MSDPTLRWARFTLAEVLLRTPGSAVEAEEHLRRALDCPGDDPPAWAVHRALARSAELRHDGPGECAQLVAAIGSAPAVDVPGLVERTQELLDRGAADAATAGGDDAVERLLGRGEEPPLVGVARLAARLALSRDQTSDAADILARAALTQADIAADEVLLPAVLVRQARQLVDAGHPAEALEHLASYPQVDRHPAIVALRATCLYLTGQASTALAVVDGDARTPEIITLAVLAQLRCAADSFGTDADRRRVRRGQIEEALAAANQAARAGGVEAMVLRAQVLLEGSVDIEEGRALLQRALSRLTAPPESLWWWSLQQQVRDDDFFRFVEVEVAAALGRDEQVQRSVAAMTFRITGYDQDGAARQRLGESLRRSGDRAGAAQAFLAAAADLRRVDMLAMALRCGEAALACREAVDTLLEVVELRRFAAAQEGAAGEQLGHVEEGLRLLDRLEQRDDVVLGTAGRALALRGLLAGCRADLERRGDPWRWAPLPYLLLAAETDPTAAYWSAHAAWALVDAGLHRAALFYAERALRVDESDSWLLETVVTCRFNWLGTIDARTRALPVPLNDPDAATDPWVATISNIAMAFDGRRDDVCATRERVTFDALWARNWRLYADIICGGLGEARQRGGALVDELTEAGERFGAVDVALLVAPQRVAEALRRADADGHGGWAAAMSRALTELVDGDPAAAGRLHGLVERAVRPFTLREIVGATVPALTAVYADRPRVVTALGEVAQRARARRAALAEDAAITAEMDSGEAPCADPVTGRAVRVLLDTAAALSSGDRQAAARAWRALPDPTPGGSPAWAMAVAAVTDRVAGPAVPSSR